MDDTYVEKIRAYFRLLQLQFQERSGAAGEPKASLTQGASISMATVLFEQYFAMLMSTGVKAALDLLAAYPCKTGAQPTSIAEVAAAIGDPGLTSEPLRVVAPNQDAKVLQPGARIDLHDVVHQVGAGETFAGIAAKFDLTLEYLAERAALASGLFAPGQPLTVSDLQAIDPDTLMEGLLESAEWNNAAAMVSRFLLSGLRLPDPGDPAFQKLTPDELLDPANLAGIATKPVFALSGQQYPIGATLPAGYQVTLASTTVAPWLTLGGQGSQRIAFGLSTQEAKLFDTIATTPLTPEIETLSRLALYRMEPPRIALQTHIAWQAAQPPVSCVPAGAAAGNPSVWMFPGSLVAELEQTASANDGGLLYELVSAKHTQVGAPAVTAEAGCYAWATLVDFGVSLPATDGPSQSIANAYVVDGADDAGAKLLQEVQARVATGERASLYLLYPPDPASGNASGMASDVLDAQQTYLLKTNLSTLTHSGLDEASGLPPVTDPTDVYAAPLADAADFLALLWEASVTRSGGFYLNYATSAGGALPGSMFGGSSSARLALVVVLESQTRKGSVRAAGSSDGTQRGGVSQVPAGELWPCQNCAILGESIDPSVTSLFVQPVAHTVQQGETPQGVCDAFKARWGVALTPGELATLNESVPQLLAVGAQLAVPVQPSYEVGYGDTLASIVAALAARGVQTSASALGTANAAALIFAPGAALQFANGVLRPATIVPAGVVGFEIARKNPDPGIAFDKLEPGQIVGELFNLVGWSLTGAGQFTASGAGLPTTPTDRSLTQSDGRTLLDPDDTSEASWHYRQTLAVAPFGKPSTSNTSPALPPPSSDPYNGVAVSAGRLGEATIALALQDCYGNAQPLPKPHESVSVPVGYYDELAGPLSWPSLAMSYLVTGPPVELSLLASMQQARYIPSASVTVPAALAAIAADLKSYTSIYHQLVQPDVSFALQTTLALASDGKTPVSHQLPKEPFQAFVSGAYVYLQALSTMTSVQVKAGSGDTTVRTLMDAYGVTAGQLFEANRAQLYSALFGSARIAVPQLYATVASDTLATIVAKWPAYQLTAAALGEANQKAPLNPGVELAAGRVGHVLVKAGDTLESLAKLPGAGDVASLAGENEALQNLFAPATSLLIGVNPNPKLPLSSDTLASFAAENGVPLERLAAANAGDGAASATFADGVAIEIPGALANESPKQFCTYSAPPGATVEGIAELFGTTTAAILALNPTQPGPGGLWICPPMRGDAYAKNSDGSLAGLAKAYNADGEALATANAATLGVLATDVGVTLAGSTYTTQQHDTLGSLVNRFAALGVSATLAEVVSAALAVPGLVAPHAAIAPVPAPWPQTTVAIEPSFGSAVFQIAVNVIESRLAELVDPDFAAATSVLSSTFTVAPEPDPGAKAETLALAGFASKLEAALPGVHVATGDPAAQGEPAGATSVWGVNLGDAKTGLKAGPAIGYKFAPDQAAYFALPPLARTPMSGDAVPITPYVSGQEPPFSGTPQPQAFRAIDLDGWLETFLTAVDLFLAPPFAVPAYALSPASTLAVVGAKQQLAQVLAARLRPVLEGSAGSPSEATQALCEAMLTRLSSAFTVNTLVQVPVEVVSQSADPRSAPRLSGQLQASGDKETAQIPAAYSFSTAKVSLTDRGSFATFLLSVKAPAQDRQVNLGLQYVVSELELPDPAETIGEYEGSYWLKLVQPLASADSLMRGLEIPVPLRSYPGPVTLAAQSASQSVAVPLDAADLLGWDLSFVYQHDDAEQDTPLVEVAFDTTPPEGASAGGQDAVVSAVFEKLAQFISAYPTLKSDLALLTTVPVGSADGTRKAAVDAFGKLVSEVAAAFTAKGDELAKPFQPSPQVLAYRLQKQQTPEAQPTLTNLVLEWVKMGSQPQAQALWPSEVACTYEGVEHKLTQVGTPNSEAATFAYPPKLIPADAQVAQRFLFEGPNTLQRKDLPPPEPPRVAATLLGAQTFQFQYVNVLGQQSARAGVSIWRNLELVSGKNTNEAFVYRTPVTSFSASAVPSILAPASEPISIGSGGGDLAEALGGLLKQLLTSQNSWEQGETLNMRFACGYSHSLAVTGNEQLTPVVPIFLVASVDFDPLGDWDWRNPDSFVAQAQAVVADWLSGHSPPASDSAAIVFDMTIYAAGEQPQPLVHASALRFALAR